MIDQEKNSCIKRITIRKKHAVKFNFDYDFVKDMTLGNNMKKQAQSKFKNLTTALPRTSENVKRQSNTDRGRKRNSLIQQSEIRFALEDIQQRGSTFYKLGFLSIEKKGKRRKAYGDFFNLKHEQMKGTMSIGQLWSNKQRSNFLKQNKIFINKVKLIEKINQFKKQNESLSKRIQSQNTLVSSYSQVLSSNFGTIRTINENQFRKQNIQRDLLQLRKQAAKLQKNAQKQQINSMFKNLQTHSESMGKLQQKYFFKLIQMM